MELPGEKLVIKMWETLVEKGVRSLLQPWQIIRVGKSRIEVRRLESLMMVQTEVDIKEILAGRKSMDGKLCLKPAIELASYDGDRTQPKNNLRSFVRASKRRKVAEEMRKAINSSKAIKHAEDILANDPQIPSQRDVEEDWLFLWQEYAGRVSTEYLQQLWGGILAGEVKSPGSCSIRTLELLKGISKSEAELISRLAEFVVEDWIFRYLKQPLEDAGFSLRNLLLMEEIGILTETVEPGIEINVLTIIPDHFLNILISHDKALVVSHKDSSKKLHIPVFPLTLVGRQLLKLGNFKSADGYLRMVGKEIIKQGFAVELADCVRQPDETVTYENAENLGSISPQAKFANFLKGKHHN